MNMSAIAQPINAHPRQETCPIHGKHDKWLFNIFSYARNVGLSQSFSFCGFCAANALRDMGVMPEPPKIKRPRKPKALIGVGDEEGKN